ncbi:4554_t:CDS:2 [Ambispora leptoticha]|uniref:4554_t:CDS:1 n=1 Tax=Ambispora leptoticha TaxID=144679 RepID=A0A9N9CHT5_9GLOM|nr:4554_t:CDS:2 [Ambispora leptoticha]
MRLLFIEAVSRSAKEQVEPTFTRFLIEKGLKPEEFFHLISTDQFKWRYAWLLGDAKHVIAEFYRYGFGTVKDIHESLYWCRRTIKCGSLGG